LCLERESEKNVGKKRRWRFNTEEQMIHDAKKREEGDVVERRVNEEMGVTEDDGRLRKKGEDRFSGSEKTRVSTIFAIEAAENAGCRQLLGTRQNCQPARRSKTGDKARGRE
jgi:hypothetical protein